MFLDYGRGPERDAGARRRSAVRADVHRVLAALDAKSGKTLWTRELWRELKGTFRDVGYSSSPLAVRDLVILPVGGRGGGSWRSVRAMATSPGRAAISTTRCRRRSLVDVDGEAQIVSLMVEGVAGFDPATGAQRWFHPHKTDYDVNARRRCGTRKRRR